MSAAVVQSATSESRSDVFDKTGPPSDARRDVSKDAAHRPNTGAHDRARHAATPAREAISAHAVVACAHTQRVLVVFSPVHSAWSIPGGFREHGETTADAARRELQEESGLSTGRGPWKSRLRDSGNAAKRGAKIFVGSFDFQALAPGVMDRIFASRRQDGESNDYGFYRLHA